MISLYLQCEPEERDALIADLWERGTLGVIELPAGLRAWFETVGGLDDLIDRFDGELIAEPEEDWVKRTERSFPPLEIGSRFWLAPPWHRVPAPAGRIRLEVNPGMACGTGWHPCTQMCLEAMERYVETGASVLDVGVGSGILSVAARLLGAVRVVACDTDPESVAIARERIGGNLFIGSADAVRSFAFDIIVANISAEAVGILLPEFRRAVRANGRLILSGFHAFDAHDPAIDSLERDGWICLVL